MAARFVQPVQPKVKPGGKVSTDTNTNTKTNITKILPILDLEKP